MKHTITQETLLKISANFSKRMEEKRIENAACSTEKTRRQNNSQVKSFVHYFENKNTQNCLKVQNRLQNDPNFKDGRYAPIKLSWEVEKMAIEMGGKGVTKIWNKEQGFAIREGKTIQYMQGHHEKNVATFPEFQGDANNIGFYTREEHLIKHQGCFRNSSDGQLFNKSKILIEINFQRNIKNEFWGLTQAIVPDLISGFRNGYSDNKDKRPVNKKIQAGIRGAVKKSSPTLLCYSIERILNTKL